MSDAFQHRVAAVAGTVLRTERRRFWSVFALAGLMSCLWMLSTPIFGAPDEPAHSIRAASVVRGQVLGDEREEFEGSLVVDAPRAYGDMARAISCYAFSRETPASCATFGDSTELVDVPTSAGRHPPAYYAVAGIGSLLSSSELGIYLMRMVSVLLTAAFVATAVVTAERLPIRRMVLLGILLAATPMLWFVGGVVNPSAAEIPAALSLWVCGAVLVLEAPDRLDAKVVRRVGIAGIVLVLSRQLAPLWLVLIALALVCIARQGAVRALVADRRARIWGVAVAVATALQVLWIVVVRPLDPKLGESESIRGLTSGSALRISFGESVGRYKEMLGWFGWLDAPPPAITVVIWTLALGALAAVALVAGRRRTVAIAAGVAAAAFLAPIGFETFQAKTAGFFWQGRYSMPLAIGVPMLLAIAVATGGRARALRIDLLAVTLAVGVGVAQVASFWQALRRNTVGYDGPLDFLFDPTWSPPVPPWTLALLFTIVAVAFVARLVGPRGRAGS